MQTIAVIDIGKTNAKLIVIDLATGAEIAARKRGNAVVPGGAYPHEDVEGLWNFGIDSLRDLGTEVKIDAISITTHGAAAVLVDDAGRLALPMLDYEHSGPDEIAGEYETVRPPFAETGAPRLPAGLNLGAQLFWQQKRFPEAFARVAHVLMYPQYWAMRLCGVAASEPTSLGCHTDLWNPWAGDFSSLVDRMGWRGLFPPIRAAGDVLGPVLPEVAAATGLAEGTPVVAGIHDSNASLVPWLDRAPPFAVMSTGTWMIAMAIGGETRRLEAARDVLVNVNALGAPVPTARFMAGREFDEITEGRIVTPGAGAVRAVLERGVMAMPSRYPGTGPFPGLEFGWVGAPEGDAERAAAASFYAALMGAECLTLIGAAGPTIVEGPFGGNDAFARMLATATGREVIAAGMGAGTGLGAALLAGPLGRKPAEPAAVAPETDPLWQRYAAAWREEVGRRWEARG